MYRVYQTPMTNGNKRNCAGLKPVLNLSALAALVLLMSACSLTSQNKTLASADTLVTGSVAKSAEPEGFEGTDAEVIKTVVVDAENIVPKTSELAWSNPDTGNSGTIVAIDKFIGSSGQKCKKFQTTVDSFAGISLYDGETCEVKRGLWVLSWFMRR